MNLLAFDTATQHCIVGLQVGDRVLTREIAGATPHSRQLLPTISALLAEAGITTSALTAIAFGAGPGSFMGVRLSLSTAQGLGFALNLPLIPVSTLQVIAQSAIESAVERPQQVLAGWDARMGAVYWSLYFVDKEGISYSSSPDQLSQPADIVVPDSIDLAAGNAWAVYRDQLPIALRISAYQTTIFPSAKALLRLAALKYARAETVSALAAKSSYVRMQVASTTQR